MLTRTKHEFHYHTVPDRFSLQASTQPPTWGLLYPCRVAMPAWGEDAGRGCHSLGHVRFAPIHASKPAPPTAENHYQSTSRVFKILKKSLIPIQSTSANFLRLKEIDNTESCTGVTDQPNFSEDFPARLKQSGIFCLRIWNWGQRRASGNTVVFRSKETEKWSHRPALTATNSGQPGFFCGHTQAPCVI